MIDRILIVDFMCLVYKFNYDYVNLEHNGKKTGIVYGVLKYLIQEKRLSKYILVAMDSPNNFRRAIYDKYKSGRPDKPEGMMEQVEILKNLIPLLGIKALSIDGFEADDVIASAASKFSKQINCLVVSDDKDLMQLVTDNVSQFSPRKQKTFASSDVIEKFGVHPSKISEFLALQGDAADSIPGAKGIGPKSAAALINSYGTIDNLYKNIGNLKPVYQEKLYKSIDLVNLSRKLTELKSELDVGGLEECLVVGANPTSIEVLNSYGLQSLSRELG